MTMDIGGDWDTYTPSPAKDLQLTYDPEWHGYVWQAHKPIALMIGPVKGYKSIGLYQVKQSGGLDLLATFRTEEKAKQMLWWLDAMAQFYMKREYI